MIRRLAEHTRNYIIFLGVTLKFASILSKAEIADTGNEINTFNN
jgi:hypothetical protein